MSYIPAVCTYSNGVCIFDSVRLLGTLVDLAKKSTESFSRDLDPWIFINSVNPLAKITVHLFFVIMIHFFEFQLFVQLFHSVYTLGVIHTIVLLQEKENKKVNVIASSSSLFIP